MKKITTLSCVIFLMSAVVSAASAQNEDVTFFVIGKHANFSQQRTGERLPIDYSFFSEVFMKAQGNAENASLILPTGERLEFEDMREAQDGSRDNILLLAGEDRFTELSDLQARYPAAMSRTLSLNLIIVACPSLPKFPSPKLENHIALN
jgi:hypothetical protein